MFSDAAPGRSDSARFLPAVSRTDSHSEGGTAPTGAGYGNGAKISLVVVVRY